MTVVGIECNGTAFLTSFQESPHQKLFLQGFCQNSARKANCTRVDIVNYLMFIISFPEMKIAGSGKCLGRALSSM